MNERGRQLIVQLQPADSIDLELVEEAEHLLRERGRQGSHSVAAVLLTSSGKCYKSLDLRSRKSSICAEPGAIAAANTAGDYDLERIVAVFRTKSQRMVVLSPCGACRELIAWHAPACQVIIEANQALWRVSAGDLFLFGHWDASTSGNPARG